MQITAIDSQTLNGAESIVCRYGGGTRGAFVISTNTRERSGLAPMVDSYSQGIRSQTLRLWPARGSGLDADDFDELVNGIFYPPLGERTLHGERDGVAYTTQCYVTSLQDVSGAEGVMWEIGVDLISGLWHAATESSATTSPVTISGNVLALPKLTISGGNAVTRQRVTVTDRTGHGVSAYLIAVTPSVALTEANYRIHANGLEIPFSFDDTKLYFRADCGPPPERTFVDIHMGASISNTVYAGALDDAGLDLTTAGTAAISVDTADAGGNPLVPSLAWHPSVSAPHNERRNYGYGLVDGNIELMDADLTGTKKVFADDADSYVLVAGVECERIRNLDLSVFAGYQKGFVEAGGGAAGTRVMRVILADADGNVPTGPLYPPGLFMENLHTYYAQWTFGNLTYPNTFSFVTTNPDGSFHTTWKNDRGVNAFASETEAALGVSVSTGADGEYYISFPADAYHGADIPLISMQLSPKVYEADDGAGDIDHLRGDTGAIPAVVFEATWVNPITHEPLDDDPATADLPPNALRGQIKAVVKYQVRDSEHWITAWERTVTGASPSGRTTAYTGISAETPGAVAIAIGLEPVASKPSFVDWGRLTVDSVPIIDLQSALTPSVVVSAAIDALYIERTIRNVRTGARIGINYLADSNGLEIDTADLTIQGTDGVGVVYGDITTNKGVRLFNLLPGENELEIVDVELSWNERLAV